MPDAVLPVWAHVAILLGALGVCAYVAERGWRREDQLRRKLGACRSSLHAAEIARDQHRKDALAKQIHIGALLAELKQYRKSLPLEMRPTQVLVVEPEEPDPAA